MMSKLRSSTLRALVAGGALAVLLGACEQQPGDQPQQQQGSTPPATGQQAG